MLGASIESADLFYGKTRRRLIVELDPALRELTREAAARLHSLIHSQRTPPAELGAKCNHCSLRAVCMPELASKSAKVRAYLEQSLAHAQNAEHR
jgi:CRISPR-associated exonuclease Cas4